MLIPVMGRNFMTHSELLSILTTFFLDPRHENVYAGRWDVWCIQNKNWDAYHALILKTDDQLNRILTLARTRAREQTNSPLGREMS